MDPTIPAFDLAEFYNRDQKGKMDFSKRFHSGFHEVGFVAIKNHGINEFLLKEFARLTRNLFALDREIKATYIDKKSSKERGYCDSEVAIGQDIKDLKEFWHIGAEDHPLYNNIWPRELPEFQDVATRLFRSYQDAGHRILSVIAVSLGQREDLFKERFGGNSILRSLYYPPIQGYNGEAIRAAAHVDTNYITILKGDGKLEDGLEIKKTDGTWYAADAPAEYAIINGGTGLYIESDGWYPSTNHRVVNKNLANPRYSYPFFFHRNADDEFRQLYEHPDKPGNVFRPWKGWTEKQYMEHILKQTKRDAPAGLGEIK